VANTVEFVVRPAQRSDVEDLRQWMDGVAGVTVALASSGSTPTSQGTVWDLLSVVCGTGGPAVAGLKALEMWLKARVTEVDVQVGDKKITVKSLDTTQALQDVANTLKQLEAGAGGNTGDDRSA
jgi:hypothetical protein